MKDLKILYLVDNVIRTLIFPGMQITDYLEWEGEEVFPAVYGAKYFRKYGKHDVRVLSQEVGWFVSPRVRHECRSVA
ncbi:MAG TPA: hypothetical protein VN445_11625 [Rectinemataceae bacterium]|nr:hypothetical protein [Rectinemataceae bacterium]